MRNQQGDDLRTPGRASGVAWGAFLAEFTVWSGSEEANKLSRQLSALI